MIRCAWAILPLLFLVVSGCSASETTGPLETANLLQGGEPGATSTPLATMPEAVDPRLTEADVEYVHQMIPHHQQALEMTALVPERSARKDVPLFAERIELSQQDEIDQMLAWLKDHRLPQPPEAHHGGVGGYDEEDPEMPGMLSLDQMTKLRNADGAEFDRLFLESMHYHHDGAITMSKELLDAGGAQEPELWTLVDHIQSDQSIEISRIEGMLAELEN